MCPSFKDFVKDIDKNKTAGSNEQAVSNFDETMKRGVDAFKPKGLSAPELMNMNRHTRRMYGKFIGHKIPSLSNVKVRK